MVTGYLKFIDINNEQRRMTQSLQVLLQQDPE